MASPYDTIKKGSLHQELGIPEGTKIPGGRTKMQELCRGSIGDRILVGEKEITINPHMKKQACFAANLGGYKANRKKK